MTMPMALAAIKLEVRLCQLPSLRFRMLQFWTKFPFLHNTITVTTLPDSACSKCKGLTKTFVE